MPGRDDEAFTDEESSQCSSGCQSGWTLYLEHSGSGQQQRRTLPYVQPDDVVLRQMLPQAEYSDEEEDSMVSDASSGPPPHLHGGEEEELLQMRGQISMLSQQRLSDFGGDQCYSSRGDGRRSASLTGSRSLISTRSHSSGEMRSRKKRRAVVQRQVESATRRHGVFDDDDLHDTASSSGVIAPAEVVEAMNDGMDLQPSCAFSVRSTGMPGLAMLRHN
ncbi:hypothetical protein D1007_16827 [Hordeum vulgare]|uniref:Uncharacterized protein n=1 Tax=Hordeum vulgare subsp. vulgare TaxID=112509 RepID=A0A8I6WE08_HORVV|nr:protein SOB FIVE-LIKE 1-like [Hordeum vulgare subsp. vulgare]KAE8806961.1 hypothetical protein D1007_16827 [Hordeum vulgare]